MLLKAICEGKEGAEVQQGALQREMMILARQIQRDRNESVVGASLLQAKQYCVYLCGFLVRIVIVPGNAFLDLH